MRVALAMRLMAMALGKSPMRVALAMMLIAAQASHSIHMTQNCADSALGACDVLCLSPVQAFSTCVCVVQQLWCCAASHVLEWQLGIDVGRLLGR